MDDVCEFCFEHIAEKATVCPHCGAFEDPRGLWRAHWDSPGDRAIVMIRNLIVFSIFLWFVIGFIAVLRA